MPSPRRNQNDRSQRRRPALQLVPGSQSASQARARNNQQSQLTTNSERFQSDSSESRLSIRSKVKNILGHHRDFQRCHTQKSSQYVKKTDPAKLSYMKSLLNFYNFEFGQEIQKFEKNLFKLFRSVVSSKSLQKPQCYYQLKKRTQMTAEQWMKDEINDLIQRIQSSKSAQISKTKQVRILSQQDLNQLDRSRQHKRSFQQFSNTIKLEKPSSTHSCEIVEPPGSKRQRTEEIYEGKCYINVSLLKKCFQLLNVQQMNSIAAPKNFAPIHCLKRFNGDTFTFGGFIPNASSQDSRSTLRSCFNVQDYVLGNSENQVLLFLTEKNLISSDETEFVISQMHAQKISLVCKLPRDVAHPQITREHFFTLTRTQPRQLEPARDIYFSDSLGWHIFAQQGNGFHSSFQIHSESAQVKDIELNQFNSRELSQNRMQYTLDLLAASIIDNILEPKQDHEFQTLIDQMLLDQMSANFNTPRFSKEKIQHQNQFFRSDFSTDNSTNSSANIQNGMFQPLSSPNGSSLFSQRGRAFNQFQSDTSEVDEVSERMQFEMRRALSSSASAKNQQQNLQIQQSPRRVSEFRPEPYQNMHHQINPQVPNSLSDISQQMSLSSPSSFKSSVLHNVQSPHDSQFTSYSLRAQQQGQFYGHPMSETVPNYTDATRFPQYQQLLQQFTQRPEFHREKELIHFNEWMFCRIHFGINYQGVVEDVMTKRTKGFKVTLGTFGGEAQMKVTANDAATRTNYQI